jgi:MYXO-CTERM domain-containing protein
MGSELVSAETMTLTYQGAGPKKNIQYSLNSGNDWGTVKAGVYNWTGGIDTFCVQLREEISIGTEVTYKVVDPALVPESPPGPGPMGSSRVTLVRDLYSRWYDTVMSQTGGSAKRYAAAFAMNIWEISHQNANEASAMTVWNKMDFALGNARFDSTNNVNNLANDMRESLGGGVCDFQWYGRLAGLKNWEYQDQLLVEPVPGVAGLIAVVGLGGIRRRRRR